jgi:hypothetical protein
MRTNNTANFTTTDLYYRTTCGLYYKSFTMVIYDRNDSGQYYKTTIMIIIDYSS